MKWKQAGNTKKLKSYIVKVFSIIFLKIVVKQIAIHVISHLLNFVPANTLAFYNFLLYLQFNLELLFCWKFPSNVKNFVNDKFIKRF